MSEIEVDKKWQAEDDLRTLMRAEEIKADPERMAKCKALANKQKKHITSIADIEDAYNEKMMGKEE